MRKPLRIRSKKPPFLEAFFVYEKLAGVKGVKIKTDNYLLELNAEHFNAPIKAW